MSATIITLHNFFIDWFSIFVNNLLIKHVNLGEKLWNPRDGGEVSGRSSARLSSRQTRNDISSLNEAWLHTLDEYVIDTPLSQVILPVMRACFFGGATYAVLLPQRGHGNQVAADIAGFLSEQQQS
jgi:hypothetical protein